MQSLRSTLEMTQLDRDEKSDAVAAAEQVCALWPGTVYTWSTTFCLCVYIYG